MSQVSGHATAIRRSAGASLRISAAVPEVEFRSADSMARHHEGDMRRANGM
jgi:hypothetical protein